MWKITSMMSILIIWKNKSLSMSFFIHKKKINGIKVVYFQQMTYRFWGRSFRKFTEELWIWWKKWGSFFVFFCFFIEIHLQVLNSSASGFRTWTNENMCNCSCDICSLLNYLEIFPLINISNIFNIIFWHIMCWFS